MFTNDNKVGISLKFVLLLFFISSSLSILFSSYCEKAIIDYLFHLILLTLSYLIAPALLKRHHQFGIIIYAITLIYVSIYLIVFFGNFVTSYFSSFTLIWPHKLNLGDGTINIFVEGKEVLYFANRRFFNHTQTWTFPLLIGFFVFLKRSRDYKSIASVIFVLLSLWWMLLYQSGGRGTTLSIFVAGAFLWSVSKKDFIPLAKPLILTSLAGWGLKYLLFDLPFSGSGQNVLRTNNNRTFRWEGALEVWWENPWFGIGPGHYGEIGPTQFVGHPHNYYLQILSEWGIFAFLSMAILFFVAALFAWKKYGETKRGSANRLNFLVMSWSFIAACCHAFFSGVMHTPLSQMWLVLILAWFIGYYKRSHQVSSKSEFIPVTVYVVSLAVVIYIVVPEILSLPEMYKAYAEQYPGRNLYPRFWEQGLFPIK